MTTMTLPTTVGRVQVSQTKPVGHLPPMLVAIVLAAATAVATVLISGPMH